MLSSRIFRGCGKKKEKKTSKNLIASNEVSSVSIVDLSVCACVFVCMCEREGRRPKFAIVLISSPFACVRVSC